MRLSSAAAATGRLRHCLPINKLGQFRCRHSSVSDELFTDVPLVFLHGMKGSHLAFQDAASMAFGKESGGFKRQRAWLTLPALLNFPPRPDDHPSRDISLPLTYSQCRKVQDRGSLVVDGTVDHILEFGSTAGVGTDGEQSFLLEHLPFYGHVTRHIQEIDKRFTCNHESHAYHVRPARNYAYDWRRSLPELSEDFHQFCEAEFPGKSVQILAHSLGGLIAYGAMKKYPDKYQPGGVFVGVPFGTGIQYLQDLHWGYFTELGRCRQFLPFSQFSFSSHWSFFPMNKAELADTFVDVTDQTDTPFVVGKSATGNPGTTFQKTVLGDLIDIDFYNVDEWERNEFGIFDPTHRHMLSSDTLQQYRDHMTIQFEIAKEWRNSTLCKGSKDLPPLAICSTNTVPTVNQILRRSAQSSVSNTTQPTCSWEYDYVSGRSVPGDGRIDFEKSFPPQGTPYRAVCLNSMHAKQMCWEQDGGSLATIWAEVTEQIENYR